MALRFIDSMAHYNAIQSPRKWSFAAGTWQSSGGRRNAPTISGPGQFTKTLTHQNRYIQGAAVLYASRGRSLALLNNGAVIMQLNMNLDNTLSILGGSVVVGHSSLAVADPGSWHYYEVDTTLGANGGGTVTLTASVRVDGLSFGLFTGASNVLITNLIDGAATVNQVGFVLDTNSVMDYYCVDTATTDINGNATTNTGFLGDVEIDAVFPDQDITTQWGSTGGDGTHAFTCVNENPPADDDTSYVSTTNTATNNTERFKYTPISGFTGTILGAQYLACARKDAEGVKIVALTVGSSTVSTVEFIGTANYLSDFYVYYTAPLDSDNGVAWTTANFNAETFGVNCIG